MPSTASKRYGYSPSEQRVLDYLDKVGGPVTTDQIVKQVYGRRVPLNGRTIVGSVVRSLIRKVQFNREPFRIKKSERRGPHPIDVWVEHKVK